MEIIERIGHNFKNWISALDHPCKMPLRGFFLTFRMIWIAIQRNGGIKDGNWSVNERGGILKKAL